MYNYNMYCLIWVLKIIALVGNLIPPLHEIPRRAPNFDYTCTHPADSPL